MRAPWLIASCLIAAPAAAATHRADTCRRGGDERRIEVVAPGTVGRACDVVYTRDNGASVKVPYNANMDANFCRARAAEMIAGLMADGFSCSTAAPDPVEASLAGRRLAAGPAPAAPAHEPPAQTASAAEAAPTAQTVAERAALPSSPLNEQLEQLRQPSLAAEAAPAPAATLTEPGEPVQLASDARPIEYVAPPPPRTAGAGRLIGPPPSIDDLVDSSVEPAAQSLPPADGAPPPRPVEDIIRNVLAANAAAWNEGNLEAFLAGYAASEELSCIRGATVAAGFSEVRKLYEAEIAAAGEMGRLSFDALDVKMTARDVATVTGRYSLTRRGFASDGVMTLVMKQWEGRWRIVQDTRIADAHP